MQTDGARLRYREDGQGPAVIFIHGWTLDLDMWEAQSAALSTHFRVIRLDRRGFGLSSGRPSLADDLDDVRALCRHLALRQVAVVGMSQGARVALALLLASPAMISCLVLDGPPPITSAESPEIPYESYRELARNSGMEAFRRAWAAHPLVRLRTQDREAHELLARMIARYAGHDLRSENVPAAAPCALPEIQVPVLVLSGEFDLESRIASADALASQAPQAQRVQIPAAGHLCNLDNPTAYNAAIASFLTRRALPSHWELHVRRLRDDREEFVMLLPTTIVGSYPPPEWLIDRSRLAARFPPRVRAWELWRIPPDYLREAQDDATIMAIKAQEDAGIDIITDGEMRRESYSNRFATALRRRAASRG